MSERHGPPAELTRNQELVLSALAEADAPLGAYAILDRLRDQGVRAPLQVYRALDKLQELGLVHRLESLNAFVACSHSDEEPHDAAAFAICEECGAVIEFADEAALAALRRWSAEAGFRLTNATIELKGRCTACAGA